MSHVDTILSLQADLRDPAVSVTVLRSIQTVVDCLSKGTDPHGWKKVDWRGSGGGGFGVRAPRNTFTKFQGPPPASGGAGSGGGAVHLPPPKYVSRFKKTGEADDAVLMLIQDKLNKFSPRIYKEVFEFLCQILDSGKTHFLKDFMKFVFQKATREETFCP